MKSSAAALLLLLRSATILLVPASCSERCPPVRVTRAALHRAASPIAGATTRPVSSAPGWAIPHEARAVTGHLTFASLTRGTDSRAGLHTQAFAYCWGRNPYGQLGSRTPSGVKTPLPVAAAARVPPGQRGP